MLQVVRATPGSRLGGRQCGGQAEPHDELALPRICPGFVFHRGKGSAGRGAQASPRSPARPLTGPGGARGVLKKTGFCPPPQGPAPCGMQFEQFYVEWLNRGEGTHVSDSGWVTSYPWGLISSSPEFLFQLGKQIQSGEDRGQDTQQRSRPGLTPCSP